MALQVWLPLTKDLRNQGLSNVTVTNYGATLDNNGKLGKCYYFDGTDDRITVSGLSLPNVWSYSCWIYSATSSRSWEAVIMLNSTGGDSDLQLGFYTYPGGNRIQNTANGQYNSGIAWTYGVWHHFCGTFDGSNLKTYIDGILINTKAITASLLSRTNLTIGARSTNAANTTASTFFQGKLNDVRIYDHCLSLMEVKELSKGLVLHYLLNRGGWGQENLLPNTNEGTTGWNWTMQVGDYTKVEETTLSGVRGCKFTRGTTTQSGWSVIYYNLINENVFKVSTNYTLSVDIYPSVSTYLDVSIRESNGTNVVCNNAGSQVISANKWNHMVFHLTSVATLPSSTGETIYFTGISPAVGNSYIFRNLKLEEGEVATPWCPNSSDALATTMGLNGTTEYDCSGFCNNGIFWAYDTGGAITYTSDTPKYQVSTYINSDNNTTNTASGSRYIYGNCELTAPQYLTVAFWCKPIAGYGSSTGQGQFSLTNNAIGASAGQDYDTCPMNHRDNVIDMCTSSGTHKTVSIAFTANEWHHYVIVYDGRYGRVYKDGVAAGATLDMGSVLPLKDMKSAVVGFSKAGGVWRSNKSYFSDFRIYATALSADDVKSLYQNSAYIDSSSNVYGAVHSEV